MTLVPYRFTGSLCDLPDRARRSLTCRRVSTSGEVQATVRRLIDDVRTRGDAALLAHAREFDQADVKELEVPRREWQRALGAVSSDVRFALEHAANSIARAHHAWLPQRAEVEVEPGVCLVRKPMPVDRAGIYVPGGRASYPSSLLMGVVPARVAGVRDVFVCTPAGANGRPSDIVLAAAEIAGATRMFAAGGAGAIAAMALGTPVIPRVACIAGPGNAYVTEAKLQLMREVRVDMPAGPSELLVIADDSADIETIAAELCAQAEHGSESTVVAVVVGSDLSERLDRALARAIDQQPRAETIRESLASGGALLEAATVEDALDFAEQFAPEHLLLAVRNAALRAEGVCNAGSVFVQGASVVFGDYVSGANHVLPTAGYARTYSGLSTDFFMRWTTIQRIAPDSARNLAPIAAILARAEGLDGHAEAALLAARISA